jgi:hypothetical protein
MSRKGWINSNDPGPHGEKRISARADGKGYVTFLHISYAGYAAGKREGGYAYEHQAQGWVDRRIRIATARAGSRSS